MGWTGQNAMFYKNGKVDRKAECDYYFMKSSNNGHYNVKKSVMVGSVYYAAIETLTRYKGTIDGVSVYEDIPEAERETWAAVFLTQVDNKNYINFYYKDMTETCGPCEDKCPESILKLLSPTTHEYAIDWRKRCYEHINKVKAERINPHALKNLPEGTSITFKANFTNKAAGITPGDTIKLTKLSYRGRSIWFGLGYKWSKNLIPADYEVLTA